VAAGTGLLDVSLWMTSCSAASCVLLAAPCTLFSWLLTASACDSGELAWLLVGAYGVLTLAAFVKTLFTVSAVLTHHGC
jgi:hypothetical protein